MKKDKYLDILVFDGDDGIKYIRYEDMLIVIEKIKENNEARDKEIERLYSIIKELKIKFYETFRIKQNDSYTITETDYKDIEEILDKVEENSK